MSEIKNFFVVISCPIPGILVVAKNLTYRVSEVPAYFIQSHAGNM